MRHFENLGPGGSRCMRVIGQLQFAVGTPTVIFHQITNVVFCSVPNKVEQRAHVKARFAQIVDQAFAQFELYILDDKQKKCGARFGDCQFDRSIATTNAVYRRVFLHMEMLGSGFHPNDHFALHLPVVL